MSARGAGARRAPRAGAAALALAAAAGAAAECVYDVSVSPAIALDVAVRCDAGVERLRPIDGAARAFATDLRGGRDADGFAAAYRVDLGAMARERDDVDSALAVGDSVLAVGAAWLLAPVRPGVARGSIAVRVATAPGVGFATAQPIADGAFRIPEAELAHAGFSAFGTFARHPMTAPGDDGATARYDAIVLDGALDVGGAVLLGWIDDMARAMAAFWHGFPADGMAIFVVPRAGRDGVPFGRDMAGGEVSTVLFVGEHATREQLYDDWVLIHELVHVGSPFVYRAGWLSEGLATYLEPLIRARHGLQTPAAMWTEFMTYMPRGAAVMGYAGLVRGGRRGWYWGGAVLMLLADVEMRRASGGAVGLEDCLRAIRREIGNYARTVTAREFIAACDAAVGGDVLARLAGRHAFSATAVDLDALWRSLGLRLDGERLTVDEEAPLAWVRRAIVRGGDTGG